MVAYGLARSTAADGG